MDWLHNQREDFALKLSLFGAEGRVIPTRSDRIPEMLFLRVFQNKNYGKSNPNSRRG